MTTINISLPEKLKKEAETLIKQGYFVSFSDFARAAIRNLLAKHRHDKHFTG